MTASITVNPPKLEENVGRAIPVVGHEIGRVRYERNPSPMSLIAEATRSVWIAAIGSADATRGATGEIANEHIPQFCIQLQWQRFLCSRIAPRRSGLLSILVEPGTRREHDEISIRADTWPKIRAFRELTTGAGDADADDIPSRDDDGLHVGRGTISIGGGNKIRGSGFERDHTAARADHCMCAAVVTALSCTMRAEHGCGAKLAVAQDDLFGEFFAVRRYQSAA